MKNVEVILKNSADFEQIIDELQFFGFKFLYSVESEEGSKVLFGSYENESIFNVIQNKNIIKISPYTLPSTDWEAQFKEHGLNYYDGFVHLDLIEFGAENCLLNPLKISPGGGFGDLSHPTTRLVIKMMTRLKTRHHVLDIGCGSGILSLAALSLGALSCIGLDIEKEALNHSFFNLHLNKMETFGVVPPQFLLPEEYIPVDKNGDLLILMNMIQKEQMQAFEALEGIHKTKGPILTSGILKEGRKSYLNWTKSLNWQLLEEFEEEGWLGFRFSR